MSSSVYPSSLVAQAPSSAAVPLRTRWTELWKTIRGPLELLPDRRQRRNAEFVALLTLLMGLSLAAGVGVCWNLHYWLPAAMSIGAALMFVGFSLNRALHYRAALIVLIATMALVPFRALLVPNVSAMDVVMCLVWASLTLLMGSSLLGIRWLVALSLLHAAGVLLIPFVQPSLWPDPVGFLVAHALTVSLMIMATTQHNHTVEQDRINDLVAANASLEALKGSLEERVIERTQELVRSKRQLEEALEALQRGQKSLILSEKMASLGRLTAGIAHEINSPLSAVRNAFAELETLVQEYETSAGAPQVTPEDHKEIASEMRNSIALAVKAAERVSAFVRGIKSQTRDLGTQEYMTFPAQPIIDEAVLLLSHDIRHKKVEVTLEKSSQAVFLFGLPGRLSQVVTNLVNNAIDACAGKDGAKIVVSLQSREHGSELRVTDNGSGISAENLPHIFDPMFTTKPFGQGTGLGLTIVHDIVSGHFKGDIRVISEPSKETSFVMSFPAPTEDSTPPRS